MVSGIWATWTNPAKLKPYVRLCLLGRDVRRASKSQRQDRQSEFRTSQFPHKNTPAGAMCDDNGASVHSAIVRKGNCIWITCDTLKRVSQCMLSRELSRWWMGLITCETCKILFILSTVACAIRMHFLLLLEWTVNWTKLCFLHETAFRIAIIANMLLASHTNKIMAAYICCYSRFCDWNQNKTPSHMN